MKFPRYRPRMLSATEEKSAQERPWPPWPEYGLIDDLLPVLADWHARGLPVALATLVSIAGSSPRPLGSEMAIAGDGAVAGYVSGGCVEAAVAAEARHVLADGQPRFLDYGDGSAAPDIRLDCGGRIGILVRPIADLGGYVSARSRARAERVPLHVATHLQSGAMRLLSVGDAAERDADWFVRCHAPPVRLVTVGGDPVTLALARLAGGLGLEPWLVRPMGPETPPVGLGLAGYERGRLDRALERVPLDAWCAVYSLTHDLHDDVRVARWALESDAFCVGVLGSQRKIADRMARLRAAGVPEVALARLRQPAGLRIGARGASEIALSILAEVIATRPR